MWNSKPIPIGMVLLFRYLWMGMLWMGFLIWRELPRMGTEGLAGWVGGWRRTGDVSKTDVGRRRGWVNWLIDKLLRGWHLGCRVSVC